MKLLRLIIAICFFVLIDQLIKNQISSGLTEHLILNKGVSFSLFAGFPWKTIIPFILFVLVGILFKNRSIGLTLIISGGISNLIDRIYRGSVIDYIDLKVIPVFNIADLLISLGCIILLAEIIKNELKTS